MTVQHSGRRRHPGSFLNRVIGCVAVIASCFVFGCGSPDASTEERVAVEIAFSVNAGGAPFQCGQAVADLGTERTTVAMTDMRFYVHDIAFIDEDGRAQPIRLNDDGIWQKDGVALLDFEDGCANGTTQMNSRIRGTTTDGPYTGLRFRIGIPNQLNSPQTVLENRGSPLNQASLFWSWRSGYKFMRIDADSNAFRFHLGSVGCDDDFNCQFENIPTILLSDFTWQTQTVTLDLDDLLEGTNLSENTTGTAPGCMGDPDDPECSSIFARLGLSSTEATAFSVRDN
ncbi:MAG: MbnP family copper-binding protein [Myxococcota bacterium]|nr:MbnP family copper-binding protein [Myxococcota bacterium]